MTDFLIFEGELEIRARGGSRTLSGRFPYNRTATVRDRGRVRKERFRSGAFGWQIREFERLQEQVAQAVKEGVEGAISDLRQELERRNVHVLAGHSFDRPLGSMLAGSARVVEADDAVKFEVDLPPEARQPSWVKDTVAAVEAGLVGGVSPGFKVPPASAVANAEELIPEPGNEAVQIRQINQAVLHELSLVTRPAYSDTDVDVRAEDFPPLPAVRRRRVWL